jgi:hypothetical protein
MSSDDRYADPPRARRRGREAWELPLALVAAALVVGLAVGTVQLFDERNRLVELKTALTPQVQQSMRFREQLQSLGSETAKLADSGNASAKKIVEAMKQQGVTLKAAGN